MAFGVPVNTTAVDCPAQIVALPDIEATGKGCTVMLTDPVSSVVHGGIPDDVTLTRLMAVLAV